jgi:hypothetical protein
MIDMTPLFALTGAALAVATLSLITVVAIKVVRDKSTNGDSL